VDVAVWVKEISQADAWDYETQLSLYLARETELPTDIHLLNFAPLGFRFRSTAGRLLFSRDARFRLNLVERTRLEYWDFRPLWEQMLKEAVK
jgi:predicted nucleotidyltransferase